MKLIHRLNKKIEEFDKNMDIGRPIDIRNEFGGRFGRGLERNIIGSYRFKMKKSIT